MFLIGLSAALLAAKKPIGFAVLTICLPLAGIGLTYTDFGTGVGVGLLFIVGSAIAFIAAMAFPEYEGPVSPDPPLLSSAIARDFGLRLGLAPLHNEGLRLGYEASSADDNGRAQDIRPGS
jgi:hypothetical protein